MPVLNVYVGSAKIALTLFGASKVEDERLIVRSAKLLVASSRSSCWILDDPLSFFLSLSFSFTVASISGGLSYLTGGIGLALASFFFLEFGLAF